MTPPQPPARLVSAARRNRAFRRVLATVGGKQYVAMALGPGEAIGRERHASAQEFWIVSGRARVDLEGDRGRPWWLFRGNYVSVEAGQQHNVSNAGSEVLRVLTAYKPPMHRKGEVVERRANGSKAPADMTPSEINRALDRLDLEASKINDALIAAGRGDERPSETRRMDDPLSKRYNANSDARHALYVEIERRYGPGAPGRLPRGFKPIGRRANGRTIRKPCGGLAVRSETGWKPSVRGAGCRDEIRWHDAGVMFARQAIRDLGGIANDPEDTTQVQEQSWGYAWKMPGPMGYTYAKSTETYPALADAFDAGIADATAEYLRKHPHRVPRRKPTLRVVR